MQADRLGQTVVIFASRRTAIGETDYARAADAMEALAAEQPGYRGFVGTRGPDGLGIAISYWADDASAKAWRDHPTHKAMRDRGRAIWYDDYTIDVARIERSYDWSRDG